MLKQITLLHQLPRHLMPSLSLSLTRSISTGKLTAPVSLSFTDTPKPSPQEQAKAQPIVVMHGLFGSKQNWKALSKAMAHRLNTRVLTVVCVLLSSVSVYLCVVAHSETIVLSSFNYSLFADSLPLSQKKKKRCGQCRNRTTTVLAIKLKKKG
jgi:hypothetical protein